LKGSVSLGPPGGRDEWRGAKRIRMRPRLPKPERRFASLGEGGSQCAGAVVRR
jgi:hypothetical protein